MSMTNCVNCGAAKDAHQDKIVAMVPQGDRCVYEVIDRGNKDE